MTAAIDVLAVMDRWIADSRMREFPVFTVLDTQATHEAEEARAAVAELIESANAMADNMYSITKAGIRTPLSTRQAATRLHAVLARIGGAV